MTALSLSNDGEIRYEPSVDFEYGDYNTSESVLWQKLQRVFHLEIADRYRELRLKEFTPEFILQFIQGEMIDKIPHNQYNKDVRLKYLIPESLEWIKVCNGTRLEHTKRWLEERFVYMDSVYEYADFAEKFAVVRSNIKGEITLRLKTYSPQKIKIKFSDAASNQVKKLVSKDKWYEFTGTINNGTDNNIYIYGAPGLMYLDGLKDLQISNLAIGNATKIVEIDCRGSRHLNQLQLGANKLLQKVDVSGCTNLGSIAEFKRLDLSNCINLKHVNCSNTKLGEVVFNEVGGSLEYLNLSNTDLTGLSLVGQEYLPSIDVSNCRELSSLSVEACNALTKISLPYSKLASFNVVECDKMAELDISYTGYLKRLDLSGCPNLTKLIMSGVSNPAITELDLTYCTKIKHLDISKCDFLGLVKFGEGCNTLKYFNAAHSGIRQFKYGRNEAADYLDLGGFSLDEVYFENAAYVEEIRNINLIAKKSMKPFYNCKNLRKIQGTVKLIGDIREGFMGCEKLVELPANFDLTEVTTLSDTFNGCKSFTRNHMISIFSKVRDVTNLYRTFSGCAGIVIDENNPFPSDLFRNCSKVTNFYWTFNGCTMRDHQIPVGLLDPMVNLETYRQPFSGAVGFLPPTYFSRCTKLVTVWDGFVGNKFTVAPNDNLFANNPKLEKVTALFNGVNTMIGQIPANLFANNPKLRYVDSLFAGCSGLVGSIPANLFANNPNIITVRSAFDRCSGLSGNIPPRLLSNNALLNDAGYLFYKCNGLTGPIPTEIFENNPSLASLDYTFAHCTGIGGETGNIQEVPPNILKGKRSLVTTKGMFRNCNLLQFTIPEGFFSDCISLTKISEMFMDCDGLNGSLPQGLFDCYDENGESVDTLIDEASHVFSGCHYLSGRIPEGLFDKFLLVTSVAAFFYDCNRIEGEIPPTLLHNCFSLISASSLFNQCWNLGKPRVTDEDPYFIDPDFFMYCTALEDLSSAFNMWNGTSKLIGELPEDLFMYCPKLKKLSSTFANCKFTGTISGSLFRNNLNLENLSEMFWDASINMIESNCITDKHNKITNFTRAFNTNALRGEAPELWISHPSAERAECFKKAVNLSNYADIPETWK
ncbi:BspA family leucine-rich repeat surface protein [Romboutsia ilealis]|uniref:BspA family leucine-rich repeat surface protein n=1 Tax=Romboutsia ilealis TaxID=1115758 RepID=UPI00272AB846|nr:BspA family leucine-rich repeat surface protein [Romboutsia ilealis]